MSIEQCNQWLLTIIASRLCCLSPPSLSLSPPIYIYPLYQPLLSFSLFIYILYLQAQPSAPIQDDAADILATATAATADEDVSFTKRGS